MQDPEDARAALQALFAASRPRTPGGSSVPSTPSAAQSADSSGADVPLRQRFKCDLQKSLQAPAAVGRLREIEEHVAKLLEQVKPAANFQPPARVARPFKPKTGVDVAVETVHTLAEPRKYIPDPVKPKPPIALSEARFRCCIIPDKSETAQSLRQKRDATQKTIHTQDGHVTRLTRELKMLRKEHWNQQQLKCMKEREMETILKEHGPKNGAAEEAAEVSASILKLREELAGAKQYSKQWSRQARRMDAELQQQFRGGGDVQKIISHHPAGEVFLPPMGSGDDSDNESDYCREAPRLASSDEEEDVRGGGGRATGQQWRPSDDDKSESASMTSPSSSGGGPSPTGKEKDVQLSSPSSSGGGPSPTGDPAPRSMLAAKPGAVAETLSHGGMKDSSSDEGTPSPKNGAAVPPLPAVSSPKSGGSSPAAPAPAPKAAAAAAAAPAAAAATAAATVADEVEEVSSEEIYSQDDEDEESKSV